ncbi:MAG: hypothetical protein PUD92_07270 [Clostridiales bacterium]|nr:hypothetical protein [Clostridiales bacterium]
MKKNVLYVYAMTNDSGLAPCVENGILTLACCKGGKNGGMRRKAANDLKEKNDVWILGLCGKRLAGDNANKVYMPVYLAKLSEAVCMKKYYSTPEYRKRADGRVYKVVNGELKPTKCNPHNDNEREKDIGGKYVLISENFTYWGDECGKSGKEIKEAFPYIFESDTDKGKCGIDKHCRGYMVDRNFDEFAEKVCEWKWFLKDKCNVISKNPISEKYNYFEDENTDEEKSVSFSCGGGRK